MFGLITLCVVSCWYFKRKERVQRQTVDALINMEDKEAQRMIFSCMQRIYEERTNKQVEYETVECNALLYTQSGV